MSEVSDVLGNEDERVTTAVRRAYSKGEPTPGGAAHSGARSGRTPVFCVAGAVAALGVGWLAWRIAKASVKRHPAVRAARLGVHVVRDHRGQSGPR